LAARGFFHFRLKSRTGVADTRERLSESEGLTAIILRRGEFEAAGPGPPFLSF
jgi:hypothetical protein